MMTQEKTNVTVEATIDAPIEKVWRFWTDPKHIIEWNSATEDWHTPRAENDLRKGGKFIFGMEARDGSAGFDFEGVYDEVRTHEMIEYTLTDGRKVKIFFKPVDDKTVVTETFETEQTHPVEMQREGWQAIMDNFKRHVEASDDLEMMHFETLIEAPVEKVYHNMLDEKHYEQWTSAFNPGSHYEGSWEKGAKILFLGTDQNGVQGGMVSRIRENIPNKFVSIEHLGVVQDGREITSGKEVDGWAGALENYTFKQSNGKTLLSVDMDVNEEFKTYFQDTWPRALDKLKAMCEGT
jgi:uncharacterized protein YndB with AHSA1/START domain